MPSKSWASSAKSGIRFRTELLHRGVDPVGGPQVGIEIVVVEHLRRPIV
jgi:hypothetical protein